MIHHNQGHSKSNTTTKNLSKSNNNKMIDPSLRRGSSGSISSDLNVSPHASGVEKLLAASGLSSVLQSQQAVPPRSGPSSSSSSSSSVPVPAAAVAPSPSSPRPVVAAAQLTSTANNAAVTAASLAESLPILSLLARASAASNFAAAANAAPLAGPYHHHHQLHHHHSYQSSTAAAAAVNNALSSLAKTLTSHSVGVAVPPSQQDLLPMGAPVPAPPTSLSAPSDAATAAATTSGGAPIRQDHIVAALRSKPQRGRKRENLNDYERMELTRTRNREHAKSTRIRKKARHEELLEMEHKFKLMADEQAKNDACRELVVQFFALRTLALRSSAGAGADSSSSKEGGVDEVRLEDVMDENASFSFDGLAPTKSTSAASISTSGSSENGGDSRPSSSSVLAKNLESFDETMRAKATRSLGQAVVPMLSYAIQGGVEGIAVSKTHSAMCRVNLMLARSLVLVRGIATFEFSDVPAPPPPSIAPAADDASASVSTAPSATSKILSVQWIPVHDVTGASDVLESIDPMVIVAMAAESAESSALSSKSKTDPHPGRLTASSISRHNASHRDSRTANVSSSSCSSSVVASSKEEAESERGDGDAA